MLGAGVAQFRRVLELLDTDDLRDLARVMQKLRDVASPLRDVPTTMDRPLWLG